MAVGAIRACVQAGHYLIKSHAVQHALKEGFDRHHIVEVVLTGIIIEEYPDDQRLPMCGRVSLPNQSIYLHVVCEYADELYVEFVTAYIPDSVQWANPPFRRRLQKR